MKIIILAVLAAAALAQSGSSTITGTVLDATGAAASSAKVRILNIESGSQLETLTNAAGLYRAGNLLPAAYRITIELNGFKPVSRGPVTLQVGQTIAVDVTLEVGAISEAINVTESGPLIESQTSQVNQVVNRKMLTGLPLPNRAASSLAALAPGVVMIDTGVGTAENYPVFSVAGGRARNQNFTLDGGNVTNATGLTRPQQLTSLPVDAMQEFTVIANNYAADMGHSTGGVVAMSTRAGTNQFHGSLFESLRNNVFDARNFFAARRAPIRLNQYGATFGGPVRKDKTHFFLTWEHTSQLTSQAVASSVPTALNRLGDFSDLRNTAGQAILIYDPATTQGRNRSPFPGNVIPTSRLDPVGVAALKYYPLPNRTGTSTNANNYSGTSADTLMRNIALGRIDHQFRPKDLITARYYINDSGTYSSGTYGIPASDPLGDITDVRVQSVLVAHTHIFTPTLTNDLRFSYLRRKFIDTRPGYNENLASQIGLTGVSGAAFPAFTIPGYATLGNPAANFRVQTPILDRQILESLSWFKGKHAYKFGAEVRFGANTETRDRSSAGAFAFTPLITSGLLPVGVQSGTGNALASFLMGEVNSGSVQVSDEISTRATYLAFYVQDDWRITNRLTFNIGLRWETELPRREINNRLNSFDANRINPISGTPGVVTFAGLDGTPERAFATDRNNFGPRAGFAYRLHGSDNTVIRGGAGIFYASTVSNTVGDSASLGFSTQASYVVAQAEVQSAFLLRNGFPGAVRQQLTPGFGAVTPGQTTNTNVSFFNPRQVAPIAYQYNLSIQHQLGSDLLVEVGYMGNVSHKLTANDFSLNQVRPELMGPGAAQLRRPFPQFSGVTWINPSIGNSTYHGGFVRAERRLSHGFSFLTHYTFSKFLDDVESSNEYGITGNYMDAYRRFLDKGLSGSDVPHRFLLTLLYEVPALRSGFAGICALLGGWRVGVLQTAQSGPSFSVFTATNTTNAFSAGPLRPDLIANPVLPENERAVSRWFNTAAFAQPAQFTFGNAPRSLLRGAALITTDATLEKSFSLREKLRFDVRGEFYNLLNQAIFNVPGNVFGGTDFGVVSSARPGRAVQLAARLSF